MNLTNVFGLVFSLTVFVTSITMALDNIWVFVEFNAIFIVVGGSAAATLVCFPAKQILNLFVVFVRRILGKMQTDYAGLVEEIATLSSASRRGSKQFEAAISQMTHPFLKDAAQIIFWLEASVSVEEVRHLLDTRAETHFTRYMNEAKIFKTIAKFPPAFGLMGTTIGMIALLQNLGGENAKDMIGPAMAIALVTTLWGVALANLIFIPIAENLAKQSEEDLVVRRMIVESVILIATDKPTKYVEEMARSFLLPKERDSDSPSNLRKSA